MNEGQVKQERRLTQPNPGSLSPIEHFLRGGMPNNARLDLVDVEAILNRCTEAGSINAEDAVTLLTPIVIDDKGLSQLRAVQEDRAVHSRIYGTFIGLNRGFPIITMLTLGTVTPGGTVSPLWDTEFFDENRNPLSAEEVQINEGFAKWFDLAKVDASKKALKFKFV